MQCERTFDPKLQALFDASSYPWGCKDRASTYLYVNRAFCDLVGLGSPLDIIGKTDYDLPGELPCCAETFRSQDREVIETGQPLRVLDIHPFAGERWHALLSIKTPLVDGNANVTGTIFYCNDLGAPFQPLSLAVCRLLGAIVTGDPEIRLEGLTSYPLKRLESTIHLEPSEAETLFYLLHNKTLTQIAERLAIALTTVELLLENLKRKFQVASQQELMEKAASWGYLNQVPGSLFCQQLSLILRDRENRDGNRN